MVFEDACAQVDGPKKAPLKKQSTFHGLPSVLSFRRASRSLSVPSVEAASAVRSKSSAQLCEEPHFCREESASPDVRRKLGSTTVVNRRASSAAPSALTPSDLLPISILDDEVPSMHYIKEGYDENDNALSPVARAPMSKTDTKLRASSAVDMQELKARRASATQDTSTVRYVGDKARQGDVRARRRSSRNSVQNSKTKLTQLLKQTQLEQLSKLQSKHQQECELLDDIRNFGKQRSQLEKDYGQALQKLVAQYLKKDLASMPETEDNDNKTVLAVWKSVLEATDKVAQTRMVAAENYKNNIYEAAKNCRTQKETQLKKCQDLLNTLQNEITETIKELTKSKKKYYDAEQLNAGAHEKYQDVTERLKRNRTGLFKNKAGLEKTVQKLQQRCEENRTQSTVARNEYLLMLSAANAHQRRYYETDMPEAMRMLDGNLYEKLQEYLNSLSQIELDVSKLSQEAYHISEEQASKISREYNIRCFLRENPVFEWGPMYEFEACGADNNGGKLQAEQSTEDNSLNREARKWAGYVVRDDRQLQRLQKLKHELENLTQKYAQNPDLTTDAAAQETEVRLEKCREDLRRVETNHLQCDARLQLLREAGVNVDTWIESAKAQAAKEAASVSHANHIRRQSQHNRSINAQTTNSALGDPQSPTSPDGFDDDFYDDETFEEDGRDYTMDNLSLPSSDHSRVYPVTCTVRYPYQATREDELTIQIGDVIEAVEDGDLDQWVKARNNRGHVGYVPENYLEFPVANVHSPSHHHYSEPPSEDYSNTLESSSSTSGTSSMTSNSTTSGNDREVGQITSGAHMAVRRGICLAKAVYEYEGCSEEELSFPEHAIINILSKNDNGIDDGWWKGEFNGSVGVFPGIVVEELSGAADQITPLAHTHSETNSPLLDRPPSFQPPPPSECPPPPPVDRNPSPDSGFMPNELAVPEVRHQRAHSDPESPVYAQIHRPNRTAPPPPMRPSFLHTKGTS